MNPIKINTELIKNINEKIDKIKEEIRSYESIKRNIMIASLPKPGRDPLNNDSTIVDVLGRLIADERDRMAEINPDVLNKLENLLAEYSK